MSVTFRNVLPPFFLQLKQIFSFLALDLITIFDFGCTLSAQNQLTSLLISTLLPIGVCLLVFGVHVFVERRYAENDRNLRGQLRTTTFTSFLVVNFLVYPSCSNTILATFSCQTFDDGTSSLTVDPSVSCQNDTYFAYRAYAILMVFVYPVGIPVLYATLLWRNRDQL